MSETPKSHSLVSGLKCLHSQTVHLSMQKEMSDSCFTMHYFEKRHYCIMDSIYIFFAKCYLDDKICFYLVLVQSMPFRQTNSSQSIILSWILSSPKGLGLIQRDPGLE